MTSPAGRSPGCSPRPPSSARSPPAGARRRRTPTTLTVYSAQHESLVRTMLEGFTEETGIELEFRDANDSELANQIVQEGDASPADVFLTENSPSIDVVDEAGLLAPLDDATLEQVGEQYRPESGNWVGFAARSTVLIYNPAEIAEAELPASMLDLADPAVGGPRRHRRRRRRLPGDRQRRPRARGRGRHPRVADRPASATPRSTPATPRS